MTFIMSYLTDNGISMASDSNITLKNNFKVIENRPYIKTKYFKTESIGVSVWGELLIKKLDFWNWFGQEMKKFFQANSSKSKFAVHLANELNDIITLENKSLQIKKQLGIHLAFFQKIEDFFRPSVFHITNKRTNGEITQFIGQPDQFPLPFNSSFYLINGGYEPFSAAYYQYIDFSRKIRSIVMNYVDQNIELKNPALPNRKILLTKECESIISTIRLYQALLEIAGLKRFIGGPINAICFTEGGLIKEYDKVVL